MAFVYDSTREGDAHSYLSVQGILERALAVLKQQIRKELLR